MSKPDDIMRWSLHQIPATKAPKMLERKDGMWVLYEDHQKAIQEAIKAEREACAKIAEGYQANMSFWMSREWPIAKEAADQAAKSISQAIRNGRIT